MPFLIEISAKAEQDIENAYSWLFERSEASADRWLTGILAAIEKLKVSPGRGSLAPESKEFPEGIRQILYRRHRVLFSIIGGSVVVLHVRHTARSRFYRRDMFPAD
ncbi:MAG: type II toxin-antitoxin system RelE/ParE family toxin [Acidobacteriaceae bacterium]